MPLLSTKQFILYTTLPKKLLCYDVEKKFTSNRFIKLQKTKSNKSIEQNRKLQYNQEDKARGWLGRVTGHFAPKSFRSGYFAPYFPVI